MFQNSQSYTSRLCLKKRRKRGGDSSGGEKRKTVEDVVSGIVEFYESIVPKEYSGAKRDSVLPTKVNR